MILTEEQTLIRDTARAFAREQVLPHVRAWEAAGEIPRALLAEMGRLGFMGMTVPSEWGGAGADMVSYVLALEDGHIPTIDSPIDAAAGGDALRRQRLYRRGRRAIALGHAVGDIDARGRAQGREEIRQQRRAGGAVAAQDARFAPPVRAQIGHVHAAQARIGGGPQRRDHRGGPGAAVLDSMERRRCDPVADGVGGIAMAGRGVAHLFALAVASLAATGARAQAPPSGPLLSLAEALATHAMITGGVLGLMLYPLSVVGLYLAYGPWIDGRFPATDWDWALIAINSCNLAGMLFAAAVSSFRGVRKAGAGRLAWLIPFLPLYWGLISIAAWRAGWQFIRNPSKWEKTRHGVARDRRTPPLVSGAGGFGPAPTSF